MLNLFEHQLEAVAKLASMESGLGCGGFLCDSPGMGKTMTMSVYLKSKREVNSHPDLIVCPQIVIHVWMRELERAYMQVDPVAEHKPKILVYHGSKRQDKLYTDNWDYIITSYDTLRCDKFIFSGKFTRVILDESHRIKNAIKNRNQTTTACFKLVSKSKYRFCVSATPFNNRMLDIISQCMFVGTAPYNTRQWWDQNIGNKKEVESWVENYVLKRTKDNILTPPTFEMIRVTPEGDEEAKNLNNMKAVGGLLTKIKNTSGNAIERRRLEQILVAVMTKSRQDATSKYTTQGVDTTPSSEVITHTSKKVSAILDKIQEFVDRDDKKGVVVFSQFISFINILEKCVLEMLHCIDVSRLDGSQNMNVRTQTIDRFNKDVGTPRVIFVSLLSGGTGISLHHGSSSVILCEPYYNSFVEYQAFDRVHRLGQTSNVSVAKFVSEHSIETMLERMKDNKDKVAGYINLGCGDKIFQENNRSSNSNKKDVDIKELLKLSMNDAMFST